VSDDADGGGDDDDDDEDDDENDDENDDDGGGGGGCDDDNYKFGENLYQEGKGEFAIAAVEQPVVMKPGRESEERRYFEKL
jgi:hypothetical protein